MNQLPASPCRPADSHKGTFGRALIVAGSYGMSGAASLAGQAALHGGAGLVTLAVPRDILPIVAGMHPAYMTVAFDAEESMQLSDQVFSNMEGKSALGLGPGLGLHASCVEMVREIYRACQVPLVLDADGLNAFAGASESLASHAQTRILTPHPGEFSRLTGLSIAEIEVNRQSLTVEYAQLWNVVLLLKGPGTVIADTDRMVVNATGNEALATGGSGDILTGIIVALLAQGMQPFEAAQLGAHLHGLAGEIASKKYPSAYVTAVEILECLADAWRALEPRKMT